MFLTAEPILLELILRNVHHTGLLSDLADLTLR